MIAEPRTVLRVAAPFYAALALGSWAWGAIFDSPVFGGAPTFTELGMGFVVGIAVVVFCHVTHILVPAVRRAADVMGEFFGPVTIRQALWLAVLSGFAEEMCFRGALWRQLGPVGTSVLFGLVHVVPLRKLALYPLFAFFVGLLLAQLREATGSVSPAIVAHLTVNAFNIAWLGRRQRERTVAAPPPPQPQPQPKRTAPDAMTLPEEIEVGDTFPITIWRYDLRVELTGTDRETLPQCLEGENLSIFQYVPRDRVYEELRGGQFVFANSFAGPLQPFPNDLAAISAYLFQTIVGIEVAERYTDEQTTDDVRAWKIVAQRGEWVKVPLLIEAPEPGRFVVDPDRENMSVLAAQWQTYPRWFQDGMRFKYPKLRGL